MSLTALAGFGPDVGANDNKLANAINGLITAVNAGALPAVADGHTIANTSGGSAAPVDTSLSALIDYAIGSTRGAVLYRGASGWAILSPGSAGQVLTAQGGGADPHWVTPSAGTPTITEWAYNAFDGV